MCLEQKGLFPPFCKELNCSVRGCFLWRSWPGEAKRIQVEANYLGVRSRHHTPANPARAACWSTTELGRRGKMWGGSEAAWLSSSLPVARNAKRFPRKFLLQQEDEGRKPIEFLDTFQPVGVSAKKWEDERADWLAAHSVLEVATLPVALLKHHYSSVLTFEFWNSVTFSTFLACNFEMDTWRASNSLLFSASHVSGCCRKKTVNKWTWSAVSPSRVCVCVYVDRGEDERGIYDCRRKRRIKETTSVCSIRLRTHLFLLWNQINVVPLLRETISLALRRTGYRGVGGRGAKGDSELINLSPGLCLQSRFMSFIFGLRNEHAETINRRRLRSRVMVRIAHYIFKLPALLKLAICSMT